MMPTAQTALPTNSILVGTAGHIDHGKTRLVGKLTGVNTDRLPEEKARGISIDLGFAHLTDGDLQIGVVDVPGHERFVRNMVAGATGINVAVLVVAADDGVMPQTREHLEIMDLLGIPTGLIALTKIDLVDDDMVELARLDIEESVSGTFLQDAPVIAVSSETGEGIDELRQAVYRTCRSIVLPETLPLFRLAIDRVFSITGHGTVVTGSVLSGDVQVGTTLDLWPQGREVRVRSVERHGEQTDGAGSRQRTAINLAGVKYEEVSRGCELATTGYLQTAQRLLVHLRVLSSSPVTLKNRAEVNLHIGTREVATRVILKGRSLEPGQSGYAELRLAEPIVSAFGQRFILRRVSPAVTIGGGRILDPAIPQTQRIRDIETLAGNLDTESGTERLSVYLAQRDSLQAEDLTIASAVGLMPDELETRLAELRQAGQIVTLSERDRAFEMHIRRLEALGRSVARTIRETVISHQPRRSLPKPTLLTACREIASQQVLEAVIHWLLQKKELDRIGENLGPVDLQVKITKAQTRTWQTMLDEIQAGGLTPPLAREFVQSLNQKLPEIEQLLNLSAEDGLIVKVGDGLFLTPSALDQARIQCGEILRSGDGATMAQLRDAWEVTRKYAVPLCEYFDAIGVTVRTGDLRTAGECLETPLVSGAS